MKKSASSNAHLYSSRNDAPSQPDGNGHEIVSPRIENLRRNASGVPTIGAPTARKKSPEKKGRNTSPSPLRTGTAPTEQEIIFPNNSDDLDERDDVDETDNLLHSSDSSSDCDSDSSSDSDLDTREAASSINSREPYGSVTPPRAPGQDDPNPIATPPKSNIVTLASWSYDNIKNSIKGTFTDCKSFWLTFFSGTTATTSAINAALAEGHGDEIDTAWWNSLDNGERALAIGLGATSFSINLMMFRYFFPRAARDGIKNVTILFTDKENRARNIAINLAVLACTIPAAFAGTVLTYKNYQWLPYGTYTASIPATLSLATNTVTRYWGANNFIWRLIHMRNVTKLTREDLSDILQRLTASDEDINAAYMQSLRNVLNKRKPATVAQAERGENTPLLARNSLATIQNNDDDNTNDAALSEDELDELIYDFTTSYIANAVRACNIREKTTGEKVRESVGTGVQIGTAALVSLTIFFTFTYLGTNGIYDIDLLANQGNATKVSDWMDMGRSELTAVGCASGISTAIFYFSAVMNLLVVLDGLRHSIRGDKKRILPLAALLILNIGAACSGLNLAQGMVRPGNVFGNKILGINLTTHPTASILFQIANYVAVFLANSLPTLKLSLIDDNEPRTPSTLSKDRFFRYIAKESTPLTPETTNAIRHALIAPPKTPENRTPIPRFGSGTAII